MSGIDEKGVVPLRETSLVLLSGGMDSTACLHWTRAKYREVRAVWFDYGQPMRDAEEHAAVSVARKLNVPIERVAMADTMRGGLLLGVPPHEQTPTSVVHRASVPVRNSIFLSVALNRAMTWWQNGPLTLVIGCCAEDAACFPDCTEAWLKAKEKELCLGSAREVHVAAPYAKMPKAGIVLDVSLRFASGVDDLLASWSCYEGTGPCGACTACVLRARALAAHGLTDRAAPPIMHGGDVHRTNQLTGR